MSTLDRISRPLRLALLAWCLLTPLLKGQEALLLKITGIEGGSTDPEHRGWLDGRSLGFETSRNRGGQGEAGVTQVSELTITRYSDASSPLLFREAAMGEPLNVELELVRGIEPRQRYYRLLLQDALVSSFSQQLVDDGLVETVKFNFLRLDLTYTDYQPKGTTATTAWFDVVEQRGGTSTGNPANTAPAVSAITNTNTQEDTAITIPFTASDPEGSALTYSATTSEPSLLPLANILLGGSGVNRTVRLQPGTNQHGTVNVSVRVSDGSLTTTRSFSLTVTPVNDPPALSPITAQTTASNTPVVVPVTVFDPDTALGSVTLAATFGGHAASFVAAGTNNSRTLTVTPPAGFVGSMPVTVVVSDGTASSSNTFQLTVTAPTATNQPPVFIVGEPSTIIAYSGRWTQIRQVEVNDGDAGTNLLTVRISVPGTLSISNATGIAVVSNHTASVRLIGTVEAVNAVLASSNGVNYMPAAGTSGSQMLLLNATDNSDGQTWNAQKLLFVRIYRSPFEEWQHLSFTSAELADAARENTLWGAKADPDADGLENLAEYALGTDPRSAAHARPAAQIETQGDERLLSLSVARRRDLDLQLSVTVSSNAAGEDWSGAPSDLEAFPAIDLANGFELVRFRDRTPVSSGSRRFMRMRWTLLPAP